MSKKWQNGTQAQLDAAHSDALLIPKKTYFRSLYGDTLGTNVYRIDSQYNDRDNVLMINLDNKVAFHTAFELEPVND